MYTERLSEKLAIVATIDPDVLTATTHDSDEVDMTKFRRVIFIIAAGTLGACATFDAKLRGGASGSATNDISGKAITQLTKAGCDDDKQAIIEITSEELQAVDPSYTHVSCRITVGAASCDGGMIALAGDARHGPAVGDDLASVDEIVA